MTGLSGYISGATRDRTEDPAIKSRLLYLLSYSPLYFGNYSLEDAFIHSKSIQ